MSKTQDAIDLMTEKGMTAYAAAKEVGITPTTLYTAIKNRVAKMDQLTCPCCGQVVREGFKIDHSVLKTPE